MLIHIAIADDDIKIRRGLSQLIDWEAIGARLVLVARNGKEVAECLENTEIDVIISDVKMPIMDGLELARFVQQRGLDIRVILLSGHAEFEYAQEAIKQGVQQYILKPLSREKLNMLAELVAEIARGKENRKQLLQKIHSADFRQKAFEILRTANEAAAREILMLEYDETGFLSEAARDYYLFLMSVLYEFAAQIGATEILPPSYTEDMIKLTDKTACAKYTQKRFAEVLSFYKKRSGSVVNNVKSYIEMSCDKEELATASIAEHFGLSAPYISSLFKSEMGISITRYITKCRMENAARLLTTTSLPIQIISRKVGYPNVPYFNKVFKEYYHLSPLAYREKRGTEA